MMKLLTVFTALSISFAAAAPVSDDCEPEFSVGQIVSTSSGPVAGHAAVGFPEVSEYLGIRFGQAPVGDLRFAAPVKFNGTALNDGSYYGSSCPTLPSTASAPSAYEIALSNVTEVGLRLISGIGSGFGSTTSEDCLYLNVWTKPQTGEKKKAVMVFFYGGGFSAGTSANPLTNGSTLANDHDVIIVSFNYRVSILGFPGNPDSQNNLAFLDQRLAVEWVCENVANFGGDPDRITFFGQSAGAASLDYITYAWVDDPIAKGIIMESGTAFSFGLPYTANQSASAWYTVTSIVGCGDNTIGSSIQLSCMRNVDINTLMAAIPTTGLSALLSPFAPTIDNKLVFANYTTQPPPSIPTLVGSNDYEAGQFRTELALGNITYPDYAWDILTLASWTCPASARANASLVFGQNSTTWRYRYFAVFPDVDISSEGGAYHGIELQNLFGTTYSPPNATAEELVFNEYLRNAWTGFAKDPVHGLEKFGWPTYDPEAETLIRLGWKNKAGLNVSKPWEYDYPCAYTSEADVLAFLGL